MQTISFYVLGEPRSQPRPRAFSLAGKARVYNPKTAEGWKGNIAVAAQPHRPNVPHAGPVQVHLTFYFPRPKAHYRTGKHAGELKPTAPVRHIKKPDRDNLDKPVLDCLKELGFYRDDSQVFGAISKYYAGPRDICSQPGMDVSITYHDVETVG